VERTLNPELAPKLTQALKLMDQLDADFKAARDEERYAQLSKKWNRVTKEISDMGRQLAKVLIQSHQLSLDVGIEGGGPKAKPWIEETSMKFERLYLVLNDDSSVDAMFKDEKIGTGHVDELTYEWYEQMVAEWLVRAIQSKRGG
jgi:hypothetical protein